MNSGRSASFQNFRMYTSPPSWGSDPVYPGVRQRVELLTYMHQMFKVVLSRVFDLRCNLDEISGAGEPLLLFSKEDGGATASKAKSTSSSAGSGAGSASSEGATKDALKGPRSSTAK